jgi:hypothetical protein
MLNSTNTATNCDSDLPVADLREVEGKVFGLPGNTFRTFADLQVYEALFFECFEQQRRKQPLTGLRITELADLTELAVETIAPILSYLRLKGLILQDDLQFVLKLSKFKGRTQS